MSNLNEQDIAEILEEQEVRYSTDLTIGELLKEWEDLLKGKEQILQIFKEILHNL